MMLAQTLPDGGMVLSALLGGAGPLGAVIYLVIRFLRHQEVEGKRNREANELLVKRVEVISTNSDIGLANAMKRTEEMSKETRDDHRQSEINLIGIIRESVGAMVAVSKQVGDLGAGVGELKDEVRGLGAGVGVLNTDVRELSVAVTSLSKRVDGLDGGKSNQARGGGK